MASKKESGSRKTFLRNAVKLKFFILESIRVQWKDVFTFVVWARKMLERRFKLYMAGGLTVRNKIRVKINLSPLITYI